MLSVFCSPARYSQGPAATAQLGSEMKALGLPGPVLIVAGRAAKRLLSSTWQTALPDAGYSYAVHDFAGECSHAEIARIVASAQASGAQAQKMPPGLGLDLRQIELMNSLHVRHRFHRVSAASRLSKALATATGPAD